MTVCRRKARILLSSFTCKTQVNAISSNVPGPRKIARRSGCPVSVSLEILGDRWSLLIIRDLMVRGYRTFKEFHEAGEGIATNILADRLSRLEAGNIITAEAEDADARRINYRLTERGIDLAPVLLELLIWGARHEKTLAPCAVIDKMAANREYAIAEVRRRWQERDLTPFLPRFENNTDAKSAGKPSGKERG
jgi:DNA-binding HxlR family transcriptional regulator